MNTQSTREILSNILDLTGYQGDKEQLINQYLKLVAATAINDLIRLKEKPIQDEIISALTKKENENEVIGVLSNYFEQILIDAAFKKASENCLTTTLKDLIGNLSADEEKKVTDYIATLTVQQQS